MIKSLLYLSILFLACTSCSSTTDSNNDFYSYSKKGDLWRVPLIEPYEVVSPTNSDFDDWFLTLKNHKIEGPDFFSSGNEFQLSSIQTIGILDSVIVVSNINKYWPKLAGNYPSTLIIDSKTGRQYLYSNEHHNEELNEKKEALRIVEVEMLEWQTIKNDFLNDSKLPKEWRNY